METDQPSKMILKETTLAEWYKITHTEPGSEKFGLGPDRPVWIVAMLATGTYAAPGGAAPGEAPPRFDNLAFVIASDTLEVISGHVAGADEALPLGLQRN